jgi:protein-S-isoprenylcysteine O-methyltransferase Ste14
MPRWWPGPRGEGYVAVQVALLAAIFLGPPHLAQHGLESVPRAVRLASFALSFACMAWALLFGLYGLLSLGRSLTVFPKPKADGRLATHGAYRWVRHPIYSGVLALAFAWLFWSQGSLTLLECVALFVLFDRKARREEVWLGQKYPDYERYKLTVKKLVPGIY